MQLNDQRDIKAKLGDVWDAILDADTLRACIPGCESMTGNVKDGYEAVVVQKVGPVSARFTGLVRMSDVVEGKSLRISGEGKGGPAGFAKGGASVTFEPIPGGTRLSYAVEANVGGKLAQLGSRIIDGFAKKLADQFFERFQAEVEGPVVTEPEYAGAGAEVAGAAAAETPEKKKGWFRRLLG